MRWYSICHRDRVLRFVPKVLSVDEIDNVIFMEDLTRNLICKAPIADIKLGRRSYVENVPSSPDERYNAKMRSFGVKWEDMHHGAVYPSKRDYMQWRDRTTTTHSLGFRFTGAQVYSLGDAHLGRGSGRRRRRRLCAIGAESDFGWVKSVVVQPVR